MQLRKPIRYTDAGAICYLDYYLRDFRHSGYFITETEPVVRLSIYEVSPMDAIAAVYIMGIGKDYAVPTGVLHRRELVARNVCDVVYFTRKCSVEYVRSAAIRYNEKRAPARPGPAASTV